MGCQGECSRSQYIESTEAALGDSLFLEPGMASWGTAKRQEKKEMILDAQIKMAKVDKSCQLKFSKQHEAYEVMLQGLFNYLDYTEAEDWEKANQVAEEMNSAAEIILDFHREEK